ncbi:zwilch kinetochore protein isoform X1 [Leptinotarsa decemlineata]|uniref:zwilch kinetochore protein isoform X1 n=1 Tax=Leptinotarsa decemlineata TaxID=7539 RepID=UPI003D30A389
MELKSILRKPPSYLEAVHYSDIWTENIELVYVEADNSDIISPKRESLLPDQSNGSILEITGSPLEVDLQGDESLIKLNKAVVNHWSEEESKHYPIDIKTARSYINQQMKLKIRNHEPLFVICNGENPQRTVLIGAHRTNKFISTCLLHVVGCLPKDNEQLSLNEMENSHRILVRRGDYKINYLVRFKYYVFGHFLQNVKDIYAMENSGSVSIEIIYNKKYHLDLPQDSPNVKKMVLQIIAGHKTSPVHFLWENLCLLQNYLDILLSNNNDRLLSLESLSSFDIFQSIKNIVGTNFWKRETKIEFSLENIRHKNILDKLWNILKFSEDLPTLRDAFHCLFEELAHTDSKFQVPEGQTSNIGIIINGILDGKFAVPTLTYQQALEFLFEIGAEKLKNDYQSIIKNFYSTSGTTISAKWSNLQKKMFSEDSNRKTRITVNLKSAKVDVMNAVSKLAYLGKLHVATEMIYLVKTHIHLPEDAFHYFSEKIYKSYVDKNAPSDYFLELQDNPLCEFETAIDTPNETIIKTELPVSWSLQMTSSADNLEATTVYHLSRTPIVPTTIFNNYDISKISEEDAMAYYVCKFESHKDFI